LPPAVVNESRAAVDAKKDAGICNYLLYSGSGHRIMGPKISPVQSWEGGSMADVAVTPKGYTENPDLMPVPRSQQKYGALTWMLMGASKYSPFH
jgi:hypothetical protein